MLRPESIAPNLPPLPPQPATTPWPTSRWSRSQPVVSDVDQLQQYCDEIFQLNDAQGVTYALQIISQGELVLDRYDAGASAAYLQYSWSMAKSITHALVGILVRQGKLDIYAPAAVPEWQGDARREITLDQLLRMSSGLEFQEDYIDRGSDVIAMLQFDGRHDVGAFAANKPLRHPPGSVWS